jgi:hypothetical protein
MPFWASVDVIEGAQRINAGNARPWKLEEVGEKLKKQYGLHVTGVKLLGELGVLAGTNREMAGEKAGAVVMALLMNRDPEVFWTTYLDFRDELTPEAEAGLPETARSAVEVMRAVGYNTISASQLVVEQALRS